MSPFKKIKFFLFPLSRAFARPTELQFTLKFNAVRRKLKAELNLLLRYSNQTTTRVGRFLFNWEMSFKEMKPNGSNFLFAQDRIDFSLWCECQRSLINSLFQTRDDNMELQKSRHKSFLKSYPTSFGGAFPQQIQFMDVNK